MNKDKIILDLCGATGAWSKNYKDNGYTVYNITLPEYDVTDYTIDFDRKHIRFEGEKYIWINLDRIYGILAAPPCTQFSLARTVAETPRDLKKGMKLVIPCWKLYGNVNTELKKTVNEKHL